MLSDRLRAECSGSSGLPAGLVGVSSRQQPWPGGRTTPVACFKEVMSVLRLRSWRTGLPGAQLALLASPSSIGRVQLSCRIWASTGVRTAMCAPTPPPPPPPPPPESSRLCPFFHPLTGISTSRGFQRVHESPLEKGAGRRRKSGWLSYVIDVFLDGLWSAPRGGTGPATLASAYLPGRRSSPSARPTGDRCLHSSSPKELFRSPVHVSVGSSWVCSSGMCRASCAVWV